MRQTYFISDLHLDKKEPRSFHQFLWLLHQAVVEKIDAIYILGDLFELWIGDDDNHFFNQSIISALKKTTLHLPVYFLCGNRDFLVGKQFLSKTGCQRISEFCTIDLYGNKILLTHGDLLCTKDKSYLRARRILRNRFVQYLFLLLPLQTRQSIAENLRKKSKHYTQNTRIEIMDVTDSAVTAMMQKHKVRTLIHGHTHQPAIHETRLLNEFTTRIVLGPWHDSGNVLIWYESGKKELVNF